MRRVEAARGRETDLLRQLRQAVKAEREWNRELRTQIQRLHAGRGMLDERTDDVHALVLRAAIELVQAEKGLLVSRSDADADGELDVVLARGFDRDPKHSAVAQRFARAVLARDEIIREDDPRRPADTEGTAGGPGDRLARGHPGLPARPVPRRDRVRQPARRLRGASATSCSSPWATTRALRSTTTGSSTSSTTRTDPLSGCSPRRYSARDPLLHRETCELAMHAGLLARDLGLDQRQRDVLVCATLLRAVGYLPLPERPRLNPGPLAPDERALVELHPRLGFDILARAPALHDVATAVLYHHERFDGTGYPAGLAGTDIPLPARVLAVLEAYGAMTHERPYRTPWPAEQACQELVAGAATQFDPEIAERFVEQVRRAPPRHARGRRRRPSSRPCRSSRSAQASTARSWPPPSTARRCWATTARSSTTSPPQPATGPRSVSCSSSCPSSRTSTPPPGSRPATRLIEQAARSTRRAAARLGGTAYRLSGRRLAIVVPARDGHVPSNALDEVQAEFLAGPAMQATMAAWSPGDEGDAVLDRARDALRRRRRAERSAQRRERFATTSARLVPPRCAPPSFADTFTRYTTFRLFLRDTLNRYEESELSGVRSARRRTSAQPPLRVRRWSVARPSGSPGLTRPASASVRALARRPPDPDVARTSASICPLTTGAVVPAVAR